jgi:hypothetical protein
MRDTSECVESIARHFSNRKGCRLREVYDLADPIVDIDPDCDDKFLRWDSGTEGF